MPYKEKGGKWRATKMIEGMRKTKQFKTKNEALKWETGLTREILEKGSTDIASLIDWANGYLDHAKNTISPKTYTDEKVPAFKRLFKEVDPEMPVDRLTSRNCLDFLTIQAKTRSGNCANKDRKNLSAGWSWGIKYMYLPKDNPFKTVDPFPSDANPRYVPPEKDFWKVYRIASDEQQLLLLIFLHTAARRGEIHRLKWDDIDFTRNNIRLGTRKRMGGSMEYDLIPMTEKLNELLSERVEADSSSSYVFHDENGEPYKYRQHLMRRLCRKAGVKRFGFHSIRHLSASILAHEGVDIPTIQSILRHKNLHTTSLYLHRLGVTENVMDKVFSDRSITE